MSEIQQNAPVCLVTGGTSGIGRATVKKFQQQGYRIATCSRHSDQLEQLQLDANHHFVSVLDLQDIAQTINFATETITKFGRIDVLVNNAASAPLNAFVEIRSEAFESMLNLNVRSTFYLTQTIWKQMLEQGRGVIVNISSLAAVDPFPGFSIYGASKAWIDLMTTALAAEGKDEGIRVCSIRAGAVETPMLRGLFPDFPADQCVSAETIAESVYACAHDPNAHPSGQHFVVAKQT